MRYVLVCCRAVRSLALGVLGIALPLALEARGATTGEIATVLAAGLLGATLLVALGPGARVRLRLWALAGYSALFAAGGVCVVAGPSPAVAALAGALSLQPNISPHAPVEHASLADGAADGERTRVFALSPFRRRRRRRHDESRNFRRSSSRDESSGLNGFEPGTDLAR